MCGVEAGRAGGHHGGNSHGIAQPGALLQATGTKMDLEITFADGSTVLASLEVLLLRHNSSEPLAAASEAVAELGAQFRSEERVRSTGGVRDA